MNIAQIEQNLQDLLKNFTRDNFIFGFMLAYGLPKSSIALLQKGNKNLSKIEGEISWKKKVLFKPVYDRDLHLAISEIKTTIKQEQRFIIVTDFKTLLAVDTKTTDSLDIDFTALPEHFDFFLPWAGMEKATHKNENPADVKAAGKMAKLFDEIKKDNPDTTTEFIHGLNVFLSRLLFCYFAEDTNIFKEGVFTDSIHSHTQVDGSDLSDYLNKLFEVLNTPYNKRENLPVYLNDFPYVNGGLFEHKHQIPTFTRRSRQAIIDAGELVWADINPDIFGSMFQAVISPDQRGSLGAHYTSVPNIMKVIEPLFLNDLKEEFEAARGNIKKVTALLVRLQNIKIFDPACGSGNFLIIAYKELRRLEIVILNELNILKGKSGSGSLDFGSDFLSNITLNNYYGIEIDDFAYEVAKLALWLAEHQMNQEFFKAFGKTNPTLPLRDAGQITHDNATRVDWELVCPKLPNDETYILGNPPYLCFNMQSPSQKEDLAGVYPNPENMKFLDYIVCWFIKASNYINDNSEYAFVTTNSICQGTQVPMIWPEIFKKNIEISFAYPEFVWTNSAKHNAGVICSIIGLRKISSKKKFIYNNFSKLEVKNINAYLINGSDIIVEKRQRPLSKLSKIATGNIPYDGGNLILSEEEKRILLDSFPEAEKFIKVLSGSYEYINNHVRYCLWIEDDMIDEALKIEPIKDRVDLVRKSRIAGGKIAQNYSHLPHRFYMTNRAIENQILIPRVSSIRRNYIPLGFLNADTIISDSAQAIYDADLYIFSILNSIMHMVWVKVVAGRLKSDYRYSAVICYNTFPFPKISESQKQELEQSVFRILEERENHSEKTLAQLYDPEKMPQGLREAHRLNDLAVERCYRSKPFETDEERLEYLFKLYEKMIAEEKSQDSLFQEEKKVKKNKKTN